MSKFNKIKNIGDKNTSPWVLCPSESNPGSFYYFNVASGESVWSCNEIEKKTNKNDNIQKITENSYYSLQPKTPPNNFRAATVLHDSKPVEVPKTWHQPPPQTFGQAAFSRYIPNVEPCTANILWMPVQCLPIDVKRPMLDQVTQTSDIAPLVQTSGMPIGQRIVNYEKPILNFDENNKITNKIVSSTPKKNNLAFGIQNNDDVFASTTPLKTHDDQFHFQNCNNISNSSITAKKRLFQIQNRDSSELEDWNALNSKKILREPVFKLTDIKKVSITDRIEKSNLKQCIKVQTPMKPIIHENYRNVEIPGNVEEVNPLKTCKVLDSNDLRHLLLAKRRKTQDEIEGATETKKPKILETVDTPKKKVTFDLSNMLDEDSVTVGDDDGNITIMTSEVSPTNEPNSESLKGFNQKSRADAWYIVPDTEVLLEDPEFIDQLVLSDKKCKLMIPQAVCAEIEALSLGEWCGRQSVIVARQLTRRFATPPRHYVVTSTYSKDMDYIFTIDNILDCCIDAANDNYYVVLISNDPQLHIKATAHNIKCYKLQDIKKTNGFINPELSFDLKSLKIVIPNDSTTYNPQGNRRSDNINAITGKKPRPDQNSTFYYDILNSDKTSLDLNLEQSGISTSNVPNMKTIPNLYEKSLRLSKTVKKKNLEEQIIQRENSFAPISIGELKAVQSFNEKAFSKTIPNLNEKSLRFSKTVTNLNVEGENIRKEKSVISNSVPISNGELKSVPNLNEKAFSKTVTNLNNPDTYLFQNAIINLHQTEPKKSLTNKPDEKTIQQKPSTKMETLFKLATFNYDKQENTKTQQSLPKPTNNLFENISIQKSTKNIIDSNSRPNTIENKMEHKFKLPTFDFQNYSKFKNKPLSQPVRQAQIINDIEFDLKKFCLANKIVVAKIKNRMHEYICCYRQIMEDALNDALQNAKYSIKNNLSPPWTLSEAITCVKLSYGDDMYIQTLTNKYSEILTTCSSEKGILKTTIAPNDFTKLLGYGILLIQQLKNVLPDGALLNETEALLNELWKIIESPIEVAVPMKAPPIAVRSEVDEGNDVTRFNYIKEKSYVLDYLKRHYNQWMCYEPSADRNPTNNLSDMKVLRTSGRNLNMVQIDNKKSITLLKSTIDNTKSNIDGLNNEPDKKYESVGNTNTENHGPKSTDIINYKTNSMINLNNIDTKIIRTYNDDNLTNLSGNLNGEHGNTVSENKKAGPKLIRNGIPTDTYENNMFGNIQINLNTDTSKNCQNNYRMITNDDHILINGDTDQMLIKDDCTNDSGFENDSTIAYSTVKVFLTELSGSFKVIKEFVDEFINVIGEDLDDERKTTYHNKATRSFKVLNEIILELKSIIQRESNDDLKVSLILLNAGVEAATDKRITRYRQVIIKCLEQAQLFRNAIKSIISICNSDADTSSIVTESINCSLRYFNIFE